MNKKLEEIQKAVRDLIERETEKLSDADYLEVLEEIEADLGGMIDCKREELKEES